MALRQTLNLQLGWLGGGVTFQNWEYENMISHEKESIHLQVNYYPSVGVQGQKIFLGVTKRKKKKKVTSIARQ